MAGNNKRHILIRYGVITVLFVFFGIIVLGKLFSTTVIEASDWNRRAKEELSRVDTIAPERGNILADNGNILACNLKVYDIKIDLRHERLIPTYARTGAFHGTKSTRWPTPRHILSACQRSASASRHIPEILMARETQEGIREAARAAQPRPPSGPQQDTRGLLERIKGFPYLKDFNGRGTRNPLYRQNRNVRIYPYGKMAYRSIGRVNENQKTREIHGYSGLEMALDSLLYGKPGLAKRVAMTSGISNWVTTPPRRGYDIHTTINIDLQEMLEDELQKVCEEADAEWGTAVLMEVASGEIKAISNIELLDDGSYGEALNRAVLPFEPGSVMKPISLMIAFEDKLVKSVNDMVDCSPFQRTNDPHGSGPKNMKQVIEQSSNPGIARVIFRGYAQDPEKWWERLAGLGFFEPMHTGIAGECTPRIKRLTPTDSRGNNITMTARHLDLARQAYGYNTELPPSSLLLTVLQRHRQQRRVCPAASSEEPYR